MGRHRCHSKRYKKFGECIFAPRLLIASILGYADERVDQAAREGMEIGGVFALATELEYEVAQKISSMVPSAELVRYSNSGTEAVMAALRVGRAVSKRDGYIMVEGGYHGVWDAALWDIDIDEWDPEKGEPEIKSSSAGVPGITKDLVSLVPFNDANALEDLLKEKHNEIGTLMIEICSPNDKNRNDVFTDDCKMLRTNK